MRKGILKSIALFSVIIISALIIGCGCGESKTADKDAAKTTTKATEKEVATTKAEVEPTQPTTAPTTTVATQPTTTTPTTVAKPAYTYKDMNAVMYAQKSVNVRSGPNTDFDKIGSLKQNQEVKVTGQCNETGWYRFEYNGSVGYCSNNYLGSGQIVQPTTKATQPTTQPATQPTTQATLSEFPHPLYMPIYYEGHWGFFDTTTLLVGETPQSCDARRTEVGNAVKDAYYQDLRAQYKFIKQEGFDVPGTYLVNGQKTGIWFVYYSGTNDFNDL